MKKFFIMAIAAITGITFAGCERPGQGNNGNGKITLDQSTMEIPVEGQGKLRAALDPASNTVTVTFTSENPEIATVTNAGIVTGVAAGTVNIIASAEGYQADTCVVNVIEASDAFAWGGMFVSRNQGYEILNDKDTVKVTLLDGTQVNCILVAGSGFVWDNNIFLDNASETGLSGEGYMAFLDMVPVLQIIDSIDGNGANFYYVAASAIAFVQEELFNPNDTTYQYCAPAGRLGDPAAQLAWAMDETGELESGVKGTELWYLDASSFRGYPTVGLVGEGVIKGDQNEVFYKTQIGWFTEKNAYGLKVVETAEGYVPAEPAAWAPIQYQEYVKSKGEASNAKRYEIQAPNTQIEKAIKQFKAKRDMEKLYIK